ncbi:MAG: dTDP-4-dehydrorhamnose reductase [Acidobacteriaceae bacterium]
MRILLFGSNGQVGTAFRGLGLRAADQMIAVGREQCDLADAAAIRRTIRQTAPEVIVNAAAYTAVDRAETDGDLCFSINADAPAMMAEEAAATGATLVHYSTDYVFDGSKTSPWQEDDPATPLNVYGASKLAGEQRIAATDARYAIFRTSWVYSNHGSNFLKSMLRLGAERPELRIVDDQRGAPTSAQAIAEATMRVLSGGPALAPGIYHLTAGGATTWCGFARAIFAGSGLTRQPKVTAIASSDYLTPARRPMYSVLSHEKFERTFGFRLSGWQKQLAEVLAERAGVAATAQNRVRETAMREGN